MRQLLKEICGYTSRFELSLFEERFNGARTTLKNHDIQLWIEDEHDITIDKLKAYVNHNHIDSNR